MTDKELKRMSRKELLELLIDQQKEIELLKEQLEQAEKEIRERQLIQETCGTMSEAALALNKVFEAADAAAKQYIENIRHISDQYEATQSSELDQLLSEVDDMLEVK